MAVIHVDCPVCGRRTEFSPANRWRPFCSERCKTNDLGAWASNGYAIAGAPLEDEVPEGDDGLQPPGPGPRRPT